MGRRCGGKTGAWCSRSTWRKAAKRRGRKPGMGAGRYLREYSEGTNGRRPVFDGPLDKVIDFMADAGFGLSARRTTV